MFASISGSSWVSLLTCYFEIICLILIQDCPGSIWRHHSYVVLYPIWLGFSCNLLSFQQFLPLLNQVYWMERFFCTSPLTLANILAPVAVLPPSNASLGHWRAIVWIKCFHAYSCTWKPSICFFH